MSPAQAELAKKFSAILVPAKTQGRDSLTELEGLAMLEAMGMEAPRHHFVTSAEDYAALAGRTASEDAAGSDGGDHLFPGPRVVVKVISPQILHKTEVGGVAIVANETEAILEAIRSMEARFVMFHVDGYTINEFAQFEPRLGHEIIFGYRFAADFGPVVSFGPGGIYAEFLAEKFKPGSANVCFSPRTATRESVRETLSRSVVFGLVSAGLRNTEISIPGEELVEALMKFISASEALAASGVSEFEVNPMVIRKGSGSVAPTPGAAAGSPAEAEAKDTAPASRLLALDCLVKLKDFSSIGLSPAPDGQPRNAAQDTRPVENLGRILAPESAAIIGVSEKGLNNGRIILKNLLENGFDPKRIYIVKPGAEGIDGCRCVPDVAHLPEKVDLFVLVIPAAGTPETLAQIVAGDKAWSVIVIPGGLEEKTGSDAIVKEMRKAFDEARARGAGPLINGGNCLGIRSVPGKYNTLFIPEHKLPMPKGVVAPLAVISQSGAFSITRISKHPDINPKYVITLGNQMDLTIGDYLDYMRDDPDIRVFAVYVEGFKALDGLKTLSAAKAIVKSGRTVIFYRAGRTSAGAGAAASHTASIAGDYPVTRELFAQAGAIVCGSLDEFDDAITIFTLLEGKKAKGNRLGAVSNAGFECVAIADNLGGMKLAKFSKATNAALAKVLDDAGITEIVDVHNPLDITPMGSDDTYDRSFRAALADENCDLGIVGIVPFTVRMNSLAADPAVHDEDVTKADSIASRYGSLMAETDKPFVAVVDTGPLYDPLCGVLEKRGVVVFRTADRALKMLELWRTSSAAR
ncbi:MAG TPA: acetate--CoA ligase family protein [Rectinemataceae bacterium]|nr:acetate--CoA ligase family protein [Rectinemataceae bacterium]